MQKKMAWTGFADSPQLAVLILSLPSTWVCAVCWGMGRVGRESGRHRADRQGRSRVPVLTSRQF